MSKKRAKKPHTGSHCATAPTPAPSLRSAQKRRKITPIKQTDVHSAHVITPSTPGASFVGDIVRKHCKLRGRIDGLFKVAHFLMDEFMEKVGAMSAADSSAAKLFKAVVLMRRDGIATQNPFPAVFSSHLERAMLAELKREFAAHGVDDVHVLQRLELDEGAPEEAQVPRATNASALAAVYFSVEKLPHKYRLLVDAAERECVAAADWSIHGAKHAEEELCDADLCVLRAYARAVLEFMRDADACVESAKLNTFEVHDEFVRYQSVVKDALGLTL